MGDPRSSPFYLLLRRDRSLLFMLMHGNLPAWKDLFSSMFGVVCGVCYANKIVFNYLKFISAYLHGRDTETSDGIKEIIEKIENTAIA